MHPRLQTEFGTFISECKKDDNQFIIETHSEHILLRIQKLIRSGELKSDDVSILYIDKQEDGSKCIKIRLDEDGDMIDDWPDGFFDEDFQEVFY